MFVIVRKSQSEIHFGELGNDTSGIFWANNVIISVHYYQKNYYNSIAESGLLFDFITIHNEDQNLNFQNLTRSIHATRCRAVTYAYLTPCDNKQKCNMQYVIPLKEVH